MNRFILAFDEINALVSTSFTLAAGDVNQVTDDVLSILVNAYKLGIQDTSEKLEHEIEIDLEDMEAALYQPIDGKTFENRVADHVNANDMAGLILLTESEFHRVYNRASQDGAETIQEDTGARITKTWLTMSDDKVRATHWDLEGVTIGIDEMFTTFDGDSALYPGGFMLAENNVNCRCILSYDITRD